MTSHLPRTADTRQAEFRFQGLTPAACRREAQVWHIGPQYPSCTQRSRFAAMTFVKPNAKCFGLTLLCLCVWGRADQKNVEMGRRTCQDYGLNPISRRLLHPSPSARPLAAVHSPAAQVSATDPSGGPGRFLTPDRTDGLRVMSVVSASARTTRSGFFLAYARQSYWPVVSPFHSAIPLRCKDFRELKCQL